MSQATNVAMARPFRHRWPEENTKKSPSVAFILHIKDIIATADEWQNTKDSFRQQACPPKLYINTNERRVNFEKSCCRSVGYNEEVSTCLFKVYYEK